MIWVAILWWGLGIVGYFLHRYCYRRIFNEWTVKDRTITVGLGLIVPPSLFVLAVIVYVMDVWKNDKNASW